MKKIVMFISMVFLFVLAIGCSATDNAWQNNIGSINLDTMSVTGDGISVEENKVIITSGGDFTVTGTVADGMIYVKSDSNVKLRLSGCSITNSNGPAVYFDNVEQGFITINENTENFIQDGSTYVDDGANAVLFSNDDLEIKGSGTLTITANHKHGIASDDDLLIQSGNINIGSYEHAIKVNNTLHITGGNIYVKTETGKGMKAEQELIVDDGHIVIDSFDEGIESKGTLVVNGGNIDITSGEDGINTGSSTTTSEAETTNEQGTEPQMPENMTSPQKPEGKARGEMPENMIPPQMPEGQHDGEMPQRAPGGGMGRIDEETAKAQSITINDGYIYIKADGDGIDSNGNLTINGGTVIIDGPTSNDNGSLDSEGTMSIIGGTVLTVSNGGMMQLPRNDDGQLILSVNLSEKQAAGTEISIKDADGNELVKYTSVKEFRSIVLSHKEIKTESEYTVYINGEQNTTVTAGVNPFGGMRGMHGGGPGEFKNGSKQNR